MCILCAGAAAAAGTGFASVPLAAARAVVHASEGAATAPHIVAWFVRPVLFSFMGLNLYSYGVMVGAALLVALWVFQKELKRASIDIDEMHCFFVFLFGFAVGSKSHLALSAFGAGEPLTWKAFDIRSGHSFMGSIIGAVGCLLILVRIKKVPVLKFLDVLLPCCLLGHTIGKIGCFLSGDGCYGPPASPIDVPWAMSFPNGAEPSRVPVHPTPLYEAALSFTVFASALLFMPTPRPEATIGRRTALVLVLYGIERVCIEPFRRHPPIQIFMGLTEYQALAVVLLIIGGMIELSISVKEEKLKSKGEDKDVASSGAREGGSPGGKKKGKKKD